MNAASQKFCGECGATPPARRPSSPTATPSRRSRRSAGTETPAPDNLVSIEPGTGRREVIVDRDRAQFPLEFVGREDDLLWLDDRLVRREDLARRRAHRRRRGHGQDPPAPRVPPEGPRDRALRRRGRRPIPAGPRSATSPCARPSSRSPGSPNDGGAAKDWTAAGAEARRGLVDIFEHPNRGELSADELRFAVAEALRWAIVRASEHAKGETVIVAVDDLHAIDGASRTAFADAVGEPPLVPSVLVVTLPARPRSGLARQHRSARVLMGLAPGLVSRLLAGTSRPSSSIGGRGIAPLYVDQLLRFSREQGGRAPTRLADLIALRVERLPPDARRVLQAIAVYGDNADDGRRAEDGHRGNEPRRGHQRAPRRRA